MTAVPANDVLGMDWVSADDEAAQLEHALSTRAADRLHEALGRPRSCPHGNPIPGVAEIDRAEVRLSTLNTGARARVSRISEVAEREAPTLLSYLSEHGITPNAKIRIIEVALRSGPMRVRVGDRATGLATHVAGNVWGLADAGDRDE